MKMLNGDVVVDVSNLKIRDFLFSFCYITNNEKEFLWINLN